MPTSGDVHLYADPATFQSHRPMLYADCEGLDAGETVPFAIHSMEQLQISEPSSNAGPHAGTKARRSLRRKPFEGEEVKVQWSAELQTNSRDYAVRHLYPRLLYTFSDVVVFVLRNPKRVL
jgi:hypothetical protein